MSEIQIIVPSVANESDALDLSLVTLTQAIAQIDSDKVAHGCLGGEFGYGADYENSVFLMHHFCWCDRDDTCPWCVGCHCDEGQDCPWCRNEWRYADKGALHPNEYPHLGAPNFWHKASGFRVWWYKWIGRGMSVVGTADLQKVFSECLASLPNHPSAAVGISE